MKQVYYVTKNDFDCRNSNLEAISLEPKIDGFVADCEDIILKVELTVVAQGTCNSTFIVTSPPKSEAKKTKTKK